MTDEIKTLELARMYETQGHTQDAFDLYTALYETSPTGEIKAGLNRMKAKLENQDENPQAGEKEDELINLIQSLGDDSEEGIELDPVSDTRLDPLPQSKVSVSRQFEQMIQLLVLENRLDQLERFQNTLLKK